RDHAEGADRAGQPRGDGFGRRADRRSAKRRGRRRRSGARRSRRGCRARSPQQRHARAARLAPRNRAGDSAENPRLSPTAWRFRVGRGARRRAGHRSRAFGATQGSGRAVTTLRDRPAHMIALAACVGLALANAARIGTLGLALALVALAASRFVEPRLLAVALAVSCAGWWWGRARLAALDRSPLTSQMGTAERFRAVVTSAARRGRFDIRVEGTIVRYGTLRSDEHVLLRLRPGRAPPQGAIIDALGEVAAARPARNGFDERRWLR